MNIGDLVILNRSLWNNRTYYLSDLGIVLEVRDHNDFDGQEVLVIYPNGGSKSWTLSSNLSEVKQSE
jgi:hypothetical protein